MTNASDPAKPADVVQRTVTKNAPWMVMAILIHVAVIAVFSVIYLSEHMTEEKEQVTAIEMTTSRIEPEAPVVEPPEIVDRRAIPKNEEAEVVTFEEDVFIPSSTQPLPEEDLHLERGDPHALLDNLPPGPSGGTAMGVGKVGHHGMGPSAFVGRTAGLGGGKFGRPGGATQGTHEAVLNGLRWLLRHQNSDGSWGAGFADLCAGDGSCKSPELALSAGHDVGLTGLALLAFLGAGYSHESKQVIVDTQMAKRYVLGKTIKDGLQWLVQHQEADGAFTAGERPNMYNQALATMAVCENYGLTQNKIWFEPARKGIQFLTNGQKTNPNGTGLWGWRYHSRQEIESSPTQQGGDYIYEMSDADTSVTAWVAMALKSAELSGIAFPPESFAGALAFVRWVSRDDGLAGYLNPQAAGMEVDGFRDHFTYHPGTMSALSMCVRTFITKDIADPFLDKAAQQIVKDLPAVTDDKLSIDYYYWYYASLALNQLDGPDSPRASGKYWNPWNEALVKVLLDLQDKTDIKDDCSKGGWLTPDRWSYAGGALYSTAISVLTLEVYYRYENAFGSQRK